MRKIASYLRRFFLPVLGIVALLVIQAVCDLSLPDYTSKIVIQKRIQRYMSRSGSAEKSRRT